MYLPVRCHCELGDEGGDIDGEGGCERGWEGEDKEDDEGDEGASLKGFGREETGGCRGAVGREYEPECSDGDGDDPDGDASCGRAMARNLEPGGAGSSRTVSGWVGRPWF